MVFSFRAARESHRSLPYEKGPLASKEVFLLPVPLALDIDKGGVAALKVPSLGTVWDYASCKEALSAKLSSIVSYF